MSNIKPLYQRLGYVLLTTFTTNGSLLPVPGMAIMSLFQKVVYNRSATLSLFQKVHKPYLSHIQN